MADQTIALQARAPQGNSMAAAIRQNSQLMNMMTQQAAAQRQTQQAQQAMEIQRVQEDRAAALAKPQLDKAGYDASTAQAGAALKFMDLSVEGLKQARSPEDAMKIGDWLKSQFTDPAYQHAVDQSLSSLPQDPAQFEPWRQQTLFQSMKAEEQLKQHFSQVTNGAASWTQATPEYAGGPVKGAAEIPGSRVEAPQGITYVKDAQGNIIPMPAKMIGGVGTGGGAGGGAVSGALQTNPGALKDGPFARSQPGYKGASGKFAVFDTPEAGIAAQENLLRGSYIGKGFNTIDNIVNRYARQGAENSSASVSNYKKYIAGQTGIDINQPITAAQVSAVAKAMREFETGNRPGGNSGGGNKVQFGVPIGAPKAPTVDPKAVENVKNEILSMYNDIQKAHDNGHLLASDQSYIANQIASARMIPSKIPGGDPTFRTWMPGGVDQKTSVENINKSAGRLLRDYMNSHPGTASTFRTQGEQNTFLKSVGGGDSSYETRMEALRNLAQSMGFELPAPRGHAAAPSRGGAGAAPRATKTTSSGW